MERTSIRDIYPDIENFRPMDITTVRNMLDGRNKEIKLNIHNDIRKEKKRELLSNQAYERIYDLCVEKINIASGFKKTDTLFNIPKGWNDCANYSMLTCADFITNKLKQEKILCTRVHDKLFITWQHLK